MNADTAEQDYLRALRAMEECQDALVEAEDALARVKERVPAWRRYELLETRGRGMS